MRIHKHWIIFFRKHRLIILGKTTARASETLGKAAENISKTNAFQTASSAASTLKEELEGQTLGGRVYRPPKVLR